LPSEEAAARPHSMHEHRHMLTIRAAACREARVKRGGGAPTPHSSMHEHQLMDAPDDAPLHHPLANAEGRDRGKACAVDGYDGCLTLAGA